jgi:hypothetical protein
MIKYIVYLHHPLGGFELATAYSIDDAKAVFLFYAEATYTNNPTASLYPYSEKNWEGAVEYENIGCPLGSPAYVLEIGPRGGVKVEKA